jgi:predicted branched-subunit amino acid permease
MPFGVAFGVAASDAGLEVWQASAYSLLVFAGSAQLAAVDVIGDGGAALAAVVAGVLLNLRCLAFGVVMAPSLGGPWWRRALWNVSTLFGASVFASAGNVIVDWGIDATVPAAFLALLWPRLRPIDQRVTAFVGALIALALVPIAPAGVPGPAAGLAAIAGWRTGQTS